MMHIEDIEIHIRIRKENVNNVLNAVLAKYPKESGFTPQEWLKKVLQTQIKDMVYEYAYNYIMEGAEAQAKQLLEQARASVHVSDDITD